MKRERPWFWSFPARNGAAWTMAELFAFWRCVGEVYTARSNAGFNARCALRCLIGDLSRDVLDDAGAIELVAEAKRKEKA